jgi:hypothetical protein
MLLPWRRLSVGGGGWLLPSSPAGEDESSVIKNSSKKNKLIDYILVKKVDRKLTFLSFSQPGDDETAGSSQ